jgi:hypothetical protein
MVSPTMLDSFPTPEVATLYAPQQAGAWELTVTPLVICPGYWGPTRAVADMATLQKDGAVWMSLAPMEIESQSIAVAEARGHVVVLGLGMGWAAAECACRAEVDRVTVVECDPDVIALHRALDLFGRLPDGQGSKVIIVEDDAYRWTPDRSVDLLLADIWLPLIDMADRAEEVRRMQANIAAKSVYFWGQELEIARQCAAAGRALDAAGIAATVRELDLPLAGPDLPDYPARTAAAAKAWMRGRWLPGTENPFA